MLNIFSICCAYDFLICFRDQLNINILAVEYPGTIIKWVYIVITMRYFKLGYGIYQGEPSCELI